MLCTFTFLFRDRFFFFRIGQFTFVLHRREVTAFKFFGLCRSEEQRRQEEEDMALAHALAASEEEARRARNRVLRLFVPPAQN